MDTKRNKTLVTVAILGALAWVISMFSFPLLPSAGFLKIDFSDLVILLGMNLLGLWPGVMIALIRSLLSYLVSFGEMGFPIGDTAAFIASLSFTIPIYFIKQKKESFRWHQGVASLGGTISLTVTLTVLNYFVLFPLYQKVMGLNLGSVFDYLLLAVIPFNLLKGAIVSLLFFLVYDKIWQPLARQQMKI